MTNLNARMIEQIIDAVSDLPGFRTMQRVMPMMPKLQRLIVAHDEKLRQENESPAVERYSKANVAAAVKFCCQQREQGVDLPFEQALELGEPEQPRPARYAAAPAAPRRYSQAAAVAAVRYCTRNPHANYARALEAFAAGRQPE